MDPLKYNEYLRLKEQVEKQEAFLNARETALNNKEIQLRNDILPNNTPRNFMRNMKSALGETLMPGNVGDLNTVIWPFFFTTQFSLVNPNETFSASYTVTQEASFIWMSYTKAVYSYSAPDFTYIDPDQPGAAGLAPNLSVTFEDSQSGRSFVNFPLDLDNVGNPRFPSKFPKPMLVLPNANMQIQFSNSDAANIYAPFVTVFGYRMRMEDAQRLLSTVYA